MDGFDAIAASALADPNLRREDPGLKQAVSEFEAYFVGEMLRRAGKSSLNTGLLDGGKGGRMFREMFYEEIGRIAARRGGLGLADAVERQEAQRAGRAAGGPPQEEDDE